MTTLDSITLCAGAGLLTDNQLCVMQAVDYVSSGGTSDHPECASRVVTDFLIRWNDALPTSADRDRLLRPLIPDVIGTRTSDADEMVRSWMAYDWLVRVHMVAWMRLSPSLTAHADAVAALPVIDSREALDAAWPTIVAARDANRAAGAAAGAAGAAAWDAWDAAGSAGAAWAAAWDARAAAGGAWDAAGSAWAAWAAAGAAGAALAPTVTELQASAQDLVRRMCAVGRDDSASGARGME
jgi:hypothetical protein